MGDVAFLSKEILFNIGLACVCRIFLSIDDSERSGKGTMDMELREIDSRLYDRDAYINDDSEVWVFVES